MAHSWDSLRKEARRLETEIEGKLVDYSKIATNLQSVGTRTSIDAMRPNSEDEAIQRRSGTSGKDAIVAEEMTSEMDALLSKLHAVVQSMQDALNGGASGAAPSAALKHTLQRHSEILHDYNQEFRKTRDSIASLREHAELLAGAQSDLARARGSTNASGSAALDALYAERASLSAATSGADTAIATGLNLKEDLERQRAMFASMVERMETMSEGLPAVNRLIGQIRRKKKRDVFIMAFVVGTLLFVTFSWKMLR